VTFGAVALLVGYAVMQLGRKSFRDADDDRRR
jgi:hypothetical protein